MVYLDFTSITGTIKSTLIFADRKILSTCVYHTKHFGKHNRVYCDVNQCKESCRCVMWHAVVIGAHHTKPLGMRCFCVPNKVYYEVINVDILSMGHLAPPLSLVCITPCHLSWLHPR